MIPIGVQTYTIRAQQKKDLEQAYLPLAQMGLRDLEIARIHFDEKTGQSVAAIAQRLGIRVAAIQVKPRQVFGDVENVVAFCRLTGCKTVVISMLPFSCIFGSEQKFYDFVRSLDRQCQLYRQQGITLAYHHHDWEYRTLSDGRTRMDVLLEDTRDIRFVHDTYWTTRCGMSSAEQIRRFGQRLIGIHLRDLTLRQKGLRMVARDGAVGSGVVDFPQVLAAAEETGCQYCAIEQKTKDPYGQLRRSLEACKKIRATEEETK